MIVELLYSGSSNVLRMQHFQMIAATSTNHREFRPGLVFGLSFRPVQDKGICSHGLQLYLHVETAEDKQNKFHKQNGDYLGKN